MRPVPINLTASVTLVELLVMGPRPRFQLIQDFGLGRGMDETVAGEAPPERPHVALKLKPAQHLGDLRDGIVRTHPVAVRNGLAVEEQAIPREHNAVLSAREARDRRILEVVAIDGIKPQQPEPARQPAEIHVQHEADCPQGRSAHAHQRREVKGFKDGINGNAITGVQAVVKAHGNTIGEDQVHFGVRDALRLDGLLDRRSAAKLVGDFAADGIRRQKIIKLGIEAEGRRLVASRGH